METGLPVGVHHGRNLVIQDRWDWYSQAHFGYRIFDILFIVRAGSMFEYRGLQVDESGVWM